MPTAAAPDPVPAPTPADVPVELVARARRPGDPGQPRMRMDVVLTVLHVQVPRTARASAATVWNHLREDVIGADERLRLGRNGIRAGIGHSQSWNAIKATLDAVAGVDVVQPEPVRLPLDYPLGMALDPVARDQTIFFVGDDGLLTGETWPQSRNFLRVTGTLNVEAPEKLRLSVVPEVRQRRSGFRWVRSQAGLSQEPDYNGRAFSAAGLTVDLGPGEFLVVAPTERADVYGMLGGALLTRTLDGVDYDSYVFLRADMTHVAYRD